MIEGEGWHFDQDANALYLYLAASPITRQVKMSDGVILDLSEDDRVVGIEVLGPHGGFDLAAVFAEYAPT